MQSSSSQVVNRALDVLLAFTEADVDLGVTEIARSLGMDKAQVHRYLASLSEKGFVHADSRTHRYSLGVRVLQLSKVFVKSFDLDAAVRPYIEDLRTATGETCGLAAWVDRHRVNLLQALSPHEIRQELPVGPSLPIHCGAAGQCLLAFSDRPQDVERVLAEPLERFTPDTVCDRTRLRRIIEEVRERGYGASIGQRVPGSASLAAPVWTWNNDVYALVISGPSFRFSGDAYREAAGLLCRTAAALTDRLKGRGALARAVAREG